MIFLLVVHREGKEKKIAQRGFKGIATVILRKKHEQLETEAAALLLISLFKFRVWLMGSVQHSLSFNITLSSWLGSCCICRCLQRAKVA